LSRIARAQTYPTQAVRLIVPFAAGAVNDITARLIGRWLSERLGQPFIIENRPGGGANIGIEAVVRAPADGYTLLVIGTTAAINATLFEKLNYNFIRDIAPVASIIRVPHVMQVNPSLPVTKMGSCRWSRKVLPLYSSRNTPRCWSSGSAESGSRSVFSRSGYCGQLFRVASLSGRIANTGHCSSDHRAGFAPNQMTVTGSAPMPR
jgi:hypothetical protein